MSQEAQALETPTDVSCLCHRGAHFLTIRRIPGRGNPEERRGHLLEHRILSTVLRCRYPNSTPLHDSHDRSRLTSRHCQVLQRCYTTLIPTEARTYISTHLNPPDLYGPFWTLTTLAFALFLSSSLAASITKYLSTEDAVYDYDFHLLSIAATMVYAYGLALPVLFWLALRYIGVGEWSVVEAISVWGYGQFVWIPVAVRRAYSYINLNPRRLTPL